MCVRMFFITQTIFSFSMHIASVTYLAYKILYITSVSRQNAWIPAISKQQKSKLQLSREFLGT
jgi:Na+/melibiose symporter-like transporter